MRLDLKTNVLAALFVSFVASQAIANEQCNTLSNGVNYAVESQVNQYCFDGDIESIAYGYHDAQLTMKKNKMTLSTFGQGVLFNVVIKLKNGESHDATFVTMKSPPIKRVMTANIDDGSVEVIGILDHFGTKE